MFRIAVFCLTTFAFFIVLGISPWTRQTTCASPLLGRLCFGQSEGRWRLFYHLGGNGPWIPRPAENDDTRLPMKCSIEQVHMISRHAERYPTTNAGKRHEQLIKRLRSSGRPLTGSLRFVNEWKYFADPDDLEELTTVGPYAGILQATNTGRKLRKHYGNLVDPNMTTKFWTCSSSRDIATAKYFANGFFGSDWGKTKTAELIVVSEAAERGGDTLTPGTTCTNYMEDEVNGHDRGYGELAKWQDVFTKPIAQRLQADVGGLLLSPIEVYGMMELCGFETLAIGSSPWCQVFTTEEWLDFEYGRDLLHFYRAGPGNEFAGSMGFLWLNATTSLLLDENAKGVYFSFVHDGDIIPLLATLGLLEESTNPSFLPNDARKNGRKWRTSDVVPMGGRLIFEKVTCSNTGLGGNLRRSYVRLFINDGIVNLEKSLVGGGLANGVGLNQWVSMVKNKGMTFGSFRDVCGLSKDAPSGITFLQRQYQQ